MCSSSITFFYIYLKMKLKRWSDFSDSINESKEIDKDFLISVLQKTFGYAFIQAETILEFEINYLNQLPDEIELFRIVFADNKSQINKNEPGAHYSDKKKELIANSSYATGYGDNKYLITVVASKEQIDFQNTLHNRILYPNENEITIKNNGKGLTIKSIMKLKK